MKAIISYCINFLMNFKFLLIFLIISACAISPGFKKEPSSKNPKRMGLKQNGITLMFHNLNKMNPGILPRIEDIQKKSQVKLNELITILSTNIVHDLNRYLHCLVHFKMN